MKKSLSMAALTAVALVLIALALVPTGLAGAQGQNLLKNPGFEEGHYNQDGIAEITVPNGWRMHWSNNESKIFDGYAVTARPETVVWNISGAPANEKDVFWKDGIYTVKIFKGWAPVWAAMSQDVSGLEVGRRYRLVAPIYIDIIADYDGGKKVPPQDGRQGRVRLGASPVGAAWRDEGAIAYSGWWTGETISPFYQAYPTFVYEFTATAPEMTVWIEMASNYPHPNNGFFIDTVGLFALDEVGAVAAAPAPAAGGGAQPAAAANAAPSGPPPTPLPTPTPRADGAVVHIVQSGDSFWSLAIRYAAVMGITPEEALVKIPEINNNPAVLTSGDELIIVPPAAEGAAVAEAPAEEGADTAVEDAEAVETPQPEEEAGAATAGPGGETAVRSVSNDDPEQNSNLSAAMPQVAPSSICVQVFEDVNGDGVRAESGEAPIADQAVTLSRGGNTVSTYITDGSGDLYCFERLEADTYQVQILPTADYVLTGDDSWAVGMSEGVVIPVNFGLQPASSDVIAAAAAPADSADAAVAAAPAEAAAPTATSNIGFIVLGVAGVLILLAGAGVYLLRRG